MITQSLSPSSEGETFVCGSLRKCMTRSTVAADNELNWKPFSSNYLAIDYELTTLNAMTKSTPGIFLSFRFLLKKNWLWEGYFTKLLFFSKPCTPFGIVNTCMTNSSSTRCCTHYKSSGSMNET